MNQTQDIHLTVLPKSSTVVQSSSIESQLKLALSGEIRFGLHDRMLYSTDASIYQVEPIGVVIPSSIEDAIAAIRVCDRLGVAMLPRGSGTALAGQSVNRAVIIDLSVNCRKILHIDPITRRARVEPGVVLDQLNEALLPHGLMFGPDVATSSHATIGGMIGNNSAGANSILFGRTVEHLISVDVVLADGSRLHLDEGASERDPVIHELTRRIADIVLPIASEIDQRIPKIRRHVDGYNLDIFLQQLRASTAGTFDRVNLAHLLCGSEGTLGATVEAELALVKRPQMRGLAIVGFEGVAEALRPLTQMIATEPSAVELVDDMVIAMAKRNTHYRQDVSVMPTPASGRLGAVMYVQYFGEGRDEIERKMDRLAAVIADAPMVRHFDAAAMDAAWRLRKASEPLLHGIPGEKKPFTFVEDTAVDPAKLAAFVEEFRTIVARHGSTAAYYAHASVGCLHIRPLIAITNEDGLATLRAIAIEVADLVVKYGGALSGEHGDGRLRSPLLTRVLGAAIAQAIGAIKNVFDPRALFNPGNLVNNDDPTQITTHLRVRPDDKRDKRFVKAEEVPTFFRYEREEGFGHAVEACNGAGLCRRMTDGGTMCPSYRVLKDERQTTRGRANALRLAVTGQLTTGGGGSASSPLWNDPETKATLDLCLSCKACKSECPSNVDLAKLKAEYTAQGYWERGGVPWRVNLMGNVRSLNRMGSAMWPLSNWLVGASVVRSVIASMMGFSQQRSLPPFGRSLRGWMQRRAQQARLLHGPESLQSRPTVLLMPDCFSQWSQPEVGHAAVEVLQAFGYRVVLPQAGCCGRAAISNGMLAQAAIMSCQTARALMDSMRREGAVAILGLEPSCVSAIKDDWLDLKMGVARDDLVALASKTWMIEEWIEREWDSHPTRPQFAKTTEEIVLHAHCHQKALWGVGSSLALLKRVFGESAKALSTGCCGMAGGFGFQEANYDLSMAIGEQDLFAKLDVHPRALVCAPGTSCRHQIEDGRHRRAMHPIELIAKALADSADGEV